MDIEIEAAKGAYFMDGANFISDKEHLVPHLEHSYDAIIFEEDVEAVVGCEEFGVGSDDCFELLGLMSVVPWR
jgi:hypothetical protein